MVGVVRGQRRFQAVVHRQQLGGEVFHRVLVGVGDVGLGAFADVVGLRLGAQPRVVMLLRLQLELA